MGQCHSQSPTHISVFPNEVVFKILQHLPPKEMKSAVLVCRFLREMAEKPRFWTWAVVTVNTKDDLQKLKIPRLQMLEEIDVTQGSNSGTGEESTWIKEEGLADLFQALGEIPTIRRIRGLEYCKGIQGIEPHLAVSILNSLEHLRLCCGEEDEEEVYGEEDEEDGDDERDEGEGVKDTWLGLTKEQLELLFTAAAEKTNLKYLQVSGQDMEADDMEEIPAFNQLFAAAVSNVEEVVLREYYKVDITNGQFEALFAIIAAEDRPIRKLTCVSDYISPMGDRDPDMLSKAFNKLEEVAVPDCCHADQVTAILRDLVEGESRLKKLRLRRLDARIFQNLDQNLVKRAKEKIGEFCSLDHFYTSEYHMNQLERRNRESFEALQ